MNPFWKDRTSTSGPAAQSSCRIPPDRWHTRNLLIGGDKQGILYVIDRDNMSGFNAGAIWSFRR